MYNMQTYFTSRQLMRIIRSPTRIINAIFYHHPLLFLLLLYYTKTRKMVGKYNIGETTQKKSQRIPNSSSGKGREIFSFYVKATFYFLLKNEEPKKCAVNRRKKVNNSGILYAV